MKSVGLDTCVVLRLLVGEPAEQADIALEYIKKCYFNNMAVFVSDIVAAEVYHAICYHYEVPRKDAVKILLDFLSSPMITPTGYALTVLSEYRGSGAGLIDRLIRIDLLDHAHEIVTFDKDFAKLPNVFILKECD
ncbi:MAG: PIN domain-containing protein [Desulfobacterales bacterium]|nr:PIN domain-containing protein [Desulfobacterales bacterium]